MPLRPRSKIRTKSWLAGTAGEKERLVNKSQAGFTKALQRIYSLFIILGSWNISQRYI